MLGYRTYEIYSSVLLHFTCDSYDMFKYNGKSRTPTQEKFKKHVLRWQFVKFEKDNNPTETMLYLCWVYVYHKNAYYRSPFTMKLRKKYSEFKNELVSQYQTDIANITLKDAIKIVNVYPHIIEQYDREVISKESVLLFDLCVKSFINSIVVNDEYRWPELLKDFNKLRPFYALASKEIKKEIQIITRKQIEEEKGKNNEN